MTQSFTITKKGQEINFESRFETLEDAKSYLAENVKYNTFVSDKNSDVRLRVAQNPNATPEILASLATDDDSDVRYWVAQNPNATPEILASLATDNDWMVRIRVAYNPNTPPEILTSLATDDYSCVRHYAAHNPNATELVRRLYLMTEAQQ